MSARVDLRPATTALATLVRGVRDDQLGAPTPCPAYSVADLLDHIGGLARAFTAAATKQDLPPDQRAPAADGTRLPPDWRDVIVGRLHGLGEAWQDPAAFDGLTMAGPVELPAPVAAAVAVDEVTVHGWDLAVATGQTYDPDPAAVAASQAFADSFEPPPGGAADAGGPFGPRVAVPDSASALDRLVAATGRDPRWRPGAG